MLFEKNIKKYYIFQFLTGLNFSEAVFYLFLLANGLNYTQTIFTQTWFTLIILLCQVPAGTLADLWSRKNVLLTGMILMLTGSIIYATSSSFLYFLIAETFWGVGVAFSFGTMSAFVYESDHTFQTRKQIKRDIL